MKMRLLTLLFLGACALGCVSSVVTTARVGVPDPRGTALDRPGAESRNRNPGASPPSGSDSAVPDKTRSAGESSAGVPSAGGAGSGRDRGEK